MCNALLKCNTHLVNLTRVLNLRKVSWVHPLGGFSIDAGLLFKENPITRCNALLKCNAHLFNLVQVLNLRKVSWGHPLGGFSSVRQGFYSRKTQSPGAMHF